MAAKKQPSNSDLLREIKTMQSAVTKIDGRVEALEVAKIATDAGQAAIEKYKLNKEETTKMDVLKQVGIILGLVTLALYAYLASKGIHLQ